MQLTDESTIDGKRLGTNLQLIASQQQKHGTHKPIISIPRLSPTLQCQTCERKMT